MKKQAYPAGDYYTSPDPPRDLTKWMNCLSQIYHLSSAGQDFNTALRHLTSAWDPMEQSDFRQWLSFYAGDNHHKYKTAQLALPENLQVLRPDLSSFPTVQPDKKMQIEYKRRQIVSRLNSAEKLATDPEILRELHDLGMASRWFEELQHIKRVIQLAPIRHAASTLPEEIILRRVGVLRREGLVRTAQELEKLTVPEPVDTAAPPAESSSEPDNAGEKALDELVEGMNFDVDDVQDLRVEAQIAPTPVPTAADLVVPESEATDVPSLDVFEAALGRTTIQDVIIRLESLANLFRNREIPRQLAIIDLMMNQLGISTFFPSLAEASSKSLDSNQYALTRVEDILSKLRGAVKTPKSQEIDLAPERSAPTEPLPERVNPTGVAEALQEQQTAEKAQKERRKEQEAAEALAQTPVTNITEDLNRTPTQALQEEV